MLAKLLMTVVSAGAALSATSAQALSISFAQGALASNLGSTAIVEDFESFNIGDTFGNGKEIRGPQADATGTTPAFGSTGNFLSVQTNEVSSYNIIVPKAVVLSFVLGSLDTYNRVVLKFLSGAVVTLNGNQIIDPFGTAFDPVEPSVADRLTLPAYNGRVFYDTLSLDYITDVSFASINNSAFEIDNISVAAPEPATWGMMILAAGMAGAALRRRRNRSAIT